MQNNDMKKFADSDLVRDIKKMMETAAAEDVTEPRQLDESKETQVDERAADTEFSAGSSIAAGAGSGETHAIVHRQTGKVVKKFGNFNSALSTHSRMPDNKNYVIKPLSTFEEVETEGTDMGRTYEFYLKEYLKISEVDSLSELSEEDQQIAMDIIEMAYTEQVESFDQLDEISVATLIRAKASAKRKAAKADDSGDESEVMKRSGQAAKFDAAAKKKFQNK